MYQLRGKQTPALHAYYHKLNNIIINLAWPCTEHITSSYYIMLHHSYYGWHSVMIIHIMHYRFVFKIN